MEAFNGIIIKQERSDDQYEQQQRNMSNIMFVAPPGDEQALYCEMCKAEYKGDCPVHGPLSFIQDTKIEKGKYPDRALYTLPPDLFVRESSIKGAGLGVFTEAEIPARTAFGPYEGIHITDSTLACASGYCWQIHRDGTPSHFIDAKEKAHSNWMRYVNCAPSESEQNLVAFQYKGDIYYRTLKPISPKQELLVWYGDDCAREIDLSKANVNPLVPNIANNTEQTEVKLQQCRLCGDWFPDLNIHYRTHAPGGGRSKKCKYCGKSFNQYKDLDRHMRIHTGEKPYKCTLCDKAFTVSYNLDTHMRTHTGEKPFKCTFCPKAFSQGQNLQTHLRLHTGEKPFPCKVCGKAFNQSSNLDTHMRIHTGEKPFKCEECGKAFNQKSFLKTHMRSHTGEKSAGRILKVAVAHTEEKPEKCDNL